MDFAPTKPGKLRFFMCWAIYPSRNLSTDSFRDPIILGLRLARMGATRLTLSLLTPYPGTEVYEHRQELGINLICDDWEQYTFSRVVMETRHLKRDKLRELYVEGLLRFLEATTH
jgi:anaerobic magnesium-protoporphyrin IX monomethyl ester cyclase